MWINCERDSKLDWITVVVSNKAHQWSEKESSFAEDWWRMQFKLTKSSRRLMITWHWQGICGHTVCNISFNSLYGVQTGPGFGSYLLKSWLLAVYYDDVIMGAMASQITSLTIVHSTVYSDADQRKHQNSASLAFVRGIQRGLVNSLHKWPVTGKCFHLMTSSWSSEIKLTLRYAKE